MTGELAARARRALRKPPRAVAQRLADELAQELERVRAPRRAVATGIREVLAATEDTSLDQAWARLGMRAYAVRVHRLDADAVESACPGELRRVLAAADDVIARRVDLLGSGPVVLTRPIDWLTDFKTGRSWPPGFHRSIEYANLDEPSDVKVPWELSRLQWAIPAGQAYLLTGSDRYAQAVRDLLEEWIEANPYAGTVNWSCTMDVALRILSWTWFFHVFHESDAWSDAGFRGRFLRSLFLHGDFVARNLERSDVNANHYTADAAGLVFAGSFFGEGRQAGNWARTGWEILCSEMPRQVHADGVDFEASTSYHRLVAELFLLPAMYRRALGETVPAGYRRRLEAMGRFTAAYTRPDGSTPCWGDADDARALPFGGQPPGDHRYLPVLIGAVWAEERLARAFPGAHAELLWLLGPEHSRAPGPAPARGPESFADGGVYILAGESDHVLVDAGPVGLAGRGGHGHNDCLAIDAWLDGEHVLADSGTYVYTASAEWRNRFRGTAFHSTPQVDGEEQNRLVRPDWLWSLCDDAAPEVRAWEPERQRLVAAHTGYRRLPQPVVPVRTTHLEPRSHQLTIADSFEGGGSHDVRVPYHLAPGVAAELGEPGVVVLRTQRQTLLLRWAGVTDWTADVEESWFSPSYGVKLPRLVVVFRRTGDLRPLRVSIGPEAPS